MSKVFAVLFLKGYSLKRNTVQGGAAPDVEANGPPTLDVVDAEDSGADQVAEGTLHGGDEDLKRESTEPTEETRPRESEKVAV